MKGTGKEQNSRNPAFFGDRNAVQAIGMLNKKKGPDVCPVPFAYYGRVSEGGAAEAVPLEGLRRWSPAAG